MEKDKRKLIILSFCCLLLLSAVFFVAKGGTKVKTPYYDTQILAAEKMQLCMDAIKGYKQELLIPMSPHEYFATGMLGDEFNFITTSLGELSAKRTTANPDMAALLVKMFHQVGLEKGDRIGAGFSGSFPSMNIAVICAAQAMGLEVIPITSVGASTYGANNPEISFPEMLHRLYKDGLVYTDSKFVTLGGDYDIGVNMDEELLGEIIKRLEDIGATIYKEKSLEKNVAHRLESYGEISCFVAVGGNVTTAGTAEGAVTLGQGVLEEHTSYGRIDAKSGVIQHYLSQEIRVINILNIKKIASGYGIPFDPLQKTEIGKGNIYFGNSYSKLAIALTLVASVGILIFVKITEG